MSDIRSHLRESKNNEVITYINEIISNLNSEGYDVVFGKIGNRTTYCLLTNKDKDVEIVGYTFIKNLKYYDENKGKLKSLQQAVARKEMAENPSKE